MTGTLLSLEQAILDQNPFAVLSLIVAPAILTNASSVLIMSTSNRLARAVDRSRELSRQLEETSHLKLELAKPRRRLQELKAAEHRTLLLLRGLRCFYLALGGFATAALISLLGAVLAPLETVRAVMFLEIAGVIAGLLAVGALVYGSALLLRETRIAVQVISERTATVRERMEPEKSNPGQPESQSSRGRLIVLRGITGAGKSSVAKCLSKPPSAFTVMELDVIKLQRYGSVENCLPEVDFFEFGRALRGALQSGADVVAVEAFVDRQHLDWFLNAIGRHYDSPNTFFVWLDCKLDESLKRKPELSKAAVEYQQGRKADRYRVDRELCIDTSDKTPEIVAQQILSYVKA
jgi:chloramphenicol 3-O-phosphotransferase